MKRGPPQRAAGLPPLDSLFAAARLATPGTQAQRHRDAEKARSCGGAGACGRVVVVRRVGTHPPAPDFRLFSRRLQLVNKGHQLLVTLLLMNAAAMEVRVRTRQALLRPGS